MGQKTNPKIYQITKTNDWNSKYIEKKSKDFYLYTTKDLEVKKFIYKFFKNYNLNIHTCKINYLSNNLNIYLSYHQNHKSIFLINNINKAQKIKFTNNSSKKPLSIKKNKDTALLKAIRNYCNYKSLIFKKNVSKIKNKKIAKITRIKVLNYFKKHLNLKKFKQIKDTESNNFLTKLFKSLINFFNNKPTKINLIIKPLNNKLFYTLKKKKQNILKNKLIKLKKFQRNDFFKEGLNIVMSSISNKNSAYLLSDFIANTLKKLKSSKFFLNFILSALRIFIFNKHFLPQIKGIQIQIKGRISKAPRARSKVIKIGNLPIITLNSNIDYSETTAFTANGTLGVKTWICYK